MTSAASRSVRENEGEGASRCTVELIHHRRRVGSWSQPTIGDDTHNRRNRWIPRAIAARADGLADDFDIWWKEPPMRMLR